MVLSFYKMTMNQIPGQSRAFGRPLLLESPFQEAKKVGHGRWAKAPAGRDAITNYVQAFTSATYATGH